MKKPKIDLPPAYAFWPIPMAPFLDGGECTFQDNGDACCEAKQENIKARSIVAKFSFEEGRKRHDALRKAAAEYRERHVAITKEIRAAGSALMQPSATTAAREHAAC